MRTIKFRGKRIDNGEWVYGYLYELPLENENVCMILTTDNIHKDNSIEPQYHLAFTLWKDLFVVDSSTIEQYTGRKDKNGKEIYEGDKVEPKFHEGEWIIHQGTDNIYQVVAIIDNQYQLKYGDNYTIQKCANVDRCARLWDITKDEWKNSEYTPIDLINKLREIAETLAKGETPQRPRNSRKSYWLELAKACEGWEEEDEECDIV